jgi:hypothetical protein
MTNPVRKRGALTALMQSSAANRQPKLIEAQRAPQRTQASTDATTRGASADVVALIRDKGLNSAVPGLH